MGFYKKGSPGIVSQGRMIYACLSLRKVATDRADLSEAGNYGSEGEPKGKDVFGAGCYRIP